MQSQAAAGFYGKLPCKGDFLQRHVSQEFVDAWDAWLQQCLFSSREQLQERWLDAYLTSPVWRFALAAGACGGGTYAGVMLPSVDRVGRYFPLTVVIQLSTEDCLLELAGELGRQWFDSAEALALGALQAHDLDLATFAEQLVALGTPSPEPGASDSAYLRKLLQDSQFGRRPGQWQIPLPDVHSLQRVISVFASRELERSLRPLALFWTDGSDLIAPCALWCRGLPPATSFAAMIAGEWQNFGWESLGPPSPAGRSGSPADTPRAWVTDAAVLVTEGGGVSEVKAGGAWEGKAGAMSEAKAGWASQAKADPVEIVVHQATLTRKPGCEPRVYFVSRPELGLWAVSCSEEQGPPGTGAAQAAADALYDISAAGSLASLAEEVRRQIETVRAKVLIAPRATGTACMGVAAVGVIAFLARDSECAVVLAGEAQAVRVRSGAVATIEGPSQSLRDVGDVLQSLHQPGDGTLLDLLTPGPTPNTGPVTVHYDTISAGDAWLLAGAQLFDPQQLTTLPASLSAERSTSPNAAMACVQHLARPGSEFGDEELPLMVLTAVSSATARLE
jgi:type VI secretion system protein ImpM